MVSEKQPESHLNPARWGWHGKWKTKKLKQTYQNGEEKKHSYKQEVNFKIFISKSKQSELQCQEK